MKIINHKADLTRMNINFNIVFSQLILRNNFNLEKKKKPIKQLQRIFNKYF